MNMKVFLVLALTADLIALTSSCVSRHDITKRNNGYKITSPQAIIYITKSDYSKLVPIILTHDKKGIASYPDVKDVYYKGSLAYPTPLHKGYLLDNRGISEDVAFIKLTYEQYAALPGTPATEELMRLIVDKNPVTRMYACGERSKFANITDELNAKIDSDDFSGFTRLK